MQKTKVLFVCVHNSARSQMAEALLQEIGGEQFQVESAGLTPGTLNPIVVEAMQEIGIDISGNETTDVFDLYKQGKLYNYVVTVCNEADSERCPIFPGYAEKLHWPFADPSKFEGTHEEKLEQTRAVREQIKEKIETWVKSLDQ